MRIQEALLRGRELPTPDNEGDPWVNGLAAIMSLVSDEVATRTKLRSTGDCPPAPPPSPRQTATRTATELESAAEEPKTTHTPNAARRE